MKTKSILALLLLLGIVFYSKAQETISGVTVPASYSVEGKSLVLNGAGIREKYFMDLYVGALFLTKKSNNASGIVNADEPMAIKIYIVSDMITKEKMQEAIKDGFKKSAGNNLSIYQTKIDAFTKAISEDIKKGAVYDIVYVSESDKVKVYKDNTFKTEISGHDFKKVLFAIWLGSDPADSDLKDSMLGED